MRGRRSISGIAAALLLCLFAGLILASLLSGAGAYRRVAARGGETPDSRSALQYVATKLRQAPSEESVSLRPFGEGDCLCIAEEIEGAEYITRVYCRNGRIMELFAPAEIEFSPEDGEKIAEADALEFSLENGLLLVKIDGEEMFLDLSHRGEVGP